MDKERFLRAIELADTTELLEQLLTELFTEREFSTCVSHLKAMFLIDDGMPWRQITNLTGHSSRTLARLSKTVRDHDSAFREIKRRFLKDGPAYFD